MTHPSILRKNNESPLPNGLIGDLYNASPGVVSQLLFETNRAASPKPELIERLKKYARSVRTIQKYVRDKAIHLIENNHKYGDPNFSMDIEAEISAYLSDLDQERVTRFNQIVEEIHAAAEEDPINLLRLKKLAAEQYRLIYGKDSPDYLRNLELPEEE